MRLKMFAAATGLFPDEGVMLGAQHTILLEVIDSIADAMDAERALTQCRRDQLFLRWGEVNELFVPSRYVVAGTPHIHPLMRKPTHPYPCARPFKVLQQGAHSFRVLQQGVDAYALARIRIETNCASAHPPRWRTMQPPRITSHEPVPGVPAP